MKTKGKLFLKITFSESAVIMPPPPEPSLLKLVYFYIFPKARHENEMRF